MGLPFTLGEGHMTIAFQEFIVVKLLGHLVFCKILCVFCIVYTMPWSLVRVLADVIDSHFANTIGSIYKQFTRLSATLVLSA